MPYDPTRLTGQNWGDANALARELYIMVTSMKLGSPPAAATVPPSRSPSRTLESTPLVRREPTVQAKPLFAPARPATTGESSRGVVQSPASPESHRVSSPIFGFTRGALQSSVPNVIPEPSGVASLNRNPATLPPQIPTLGIYGGAPTKQAIPTPYPAVAVSPDAYTFGDESAPSRQPVHGLSKPVDLVPIRNPALSSPDTPITQTPGLLSVPATPGGSVISAQHVERQHPLSGSLFESALSAGYDPAVFSVGAPVANEGSPAVALTDTEPDWDFRPPSPDVTPEPLAPILAYITSDGVTAATLGSPGSFSMTAGTGTCYLITFDGTTLTQEDQNEITLYSKCLVPIAGDQVVFVGYVNQDLWVSEEPKATYVAYPTAAIAVNAYASLTVYQTQGGNKTSIGTFNCYNYDGPSTTAGNGTSTYALNLVHDGAGNMTIVSQACS